MTDETLRLTPKAANVVRVFLVNPRRPQYGYELCRQVGVGSGTLYPTLARLENAGWLRSFWVEPTEPGRLERRAYVMTEAGQLAARRSLNGGVYQPPSRTVQALTRAVDWLAAKIRRETP